MEPRRPAHVLAEDVVVEDRYRDRPVVVCGPPFAPGTAGAALDDVVTDGDEELLSTFFRGFTTTRLDGDASEWPLPTPGDGLEWGVRDGRVGLSTDQSYPGGPDRAEEVVDLVESVVDALSLVERGRFGAEEGGRALSREAGRRRRRRSRPENEHDRQGQRWRADARRETAGESRSPLAPDPQGEAHPSVELTLPECNPSEGENSPQASGRGPAPCPRVARSAAAGKLFVASIDSGERRLSRHRYSVEPNARVV